MINKKQSRLRRARATRARILLQKVDRLNGRTLVSASTVEPEVRAQLASVSGRGGNVAAAKIVGARIAEKAKAAGIESCAFDRSGYRFHGRVAALAEAAREAGLKF